MTLASNLPKTVKPGGVVLIYVLMLGTRLSCEQALSFEVSCASGRAAKASALSWLRRLAFAVPPLAHETPKEILLAGWNKA